MSKLTMMTAAAAGYVLGARAGRQRYEQIAAGARRVMRDPRVQAAKGKAQDVAAEQAATVRDAAAGKAKEAASSLASSVTHKVRGDSNGTRAAEPTLRAEGTTGGY